MFHADSKEIKSDQIGWMPRLITVCWVHKYYLTLCHLGIFSLVFVIGFFKKSNLWKILSGIPFKCQTDWVPDQARQNVGPDLGPICLQRL